MVIKRVLLIFILAMAIKAQKQCPDSTIYVNNTCLTVDQISKTAGNTGHISSVFYGIASGYRSVFPIIYNINSLKGSTNNSDLFFKMLPSSITFISAGALNQFVKYRRKEMMNSLGVKKLKTRGLLVTGLVLFSASIGTDLLHSASCLMENERFESAMVVTNSIVLTSSFIVNIIGKVAQAKELDKSAEGALSSKRVSLAPYLKFNGKKSDFGIALNF